MQGHTSECTGLWKPKGLGHPLLPGSGWGRPGAAGRDPGLLTGGGPHRPLPVVEEKCARDGVRG